MNIFDVNEIIVQKFENIAARIAGKTNLPQSFKAVFQNSFTASVSRDLSQDAVKQMPASDTKKMTQNDNILSSPYNLEKSSYIPSYSSIILSKSEIARIATKKAKEYNLPPSLVLSVIEAESGFRQDAVSKAGAIELCSLCQTLQKRLVSTLTTRLKI